LVNIERRRRAYEANKGGPVPSVNDDIGVGQSMAIAAGRGLTTVGRGLGLVDKEDEAVTKSYRGLQDNHPVATTVGEIAGESAPFMLPGGAAAKWASLAKKYKTLARVGATMTTGALEGGVIRRGQGGDTKDQLTSAGVGGVAAGFMELVLPHVGRLGGKIVRRVTGKAPDGALVTPDGNPSPQLVAALDEVGMDFDDLVDESVDYLQKTPVNVKEAARKEFLESQGLKPTRAQVSRSASDFQAQQEAYKTSTGVRDALEEQEGILSNRFDAAAEGAGRESEDTAASLIQYVTGKREAVDNQITSLYQQAREAVPGEKVVKLDGLAKRLKDMAGSETKSGGVISAVVGDLKSRGVIDKKWRAQGRIDPETAETIRKYMNQLYDEKGGYGNQVLRELKDALDDDVFGSMGKDYYKQARKAKADYEKGLSRAKVSKYDRRKKNLVRDMQENIVSPDRAVDTIVFSRTSRAEDLSQLKNYATGDEAGVAAWDGMRREVLQTIKERAFTGAEDANGFQVLSRPKLQKTMRDIGTEKLRVLFEPEELKFLRDMVQVSKLREPVRETFKGKGPSAQAVSGLQKRLGKLDLMMQIFNVVDVNGKAALRGNPTKLIGAPQASPGRAAAAAVPIAGLTNDEDER
jgi:hypothetical protein